LKKPQLEEEADNKSISEEPLVTDDAVRDVVKYCPNLQYLSLSKLPKICNLSLLYIADFCSNLESLVLQKNSHVSDHYVAYVGRLCRSLRYIDVNECPRLTNKPMVHYLLRTRPGIEIFFLNTLQKSVDYDWYEPLSEEHTNFETDIDIYLNNL